MPSYNAFSQRTAFSIDLIHSRDINLGNSPNLTALAGVKSSVRSTTSLGNSRAETGISTGKGNLGVQVLLSSDSTRAVVIALSTGTVSSSSQYISNINIKYPLWANSPRHVWAGGTGVGGKQSAGHSVSDGPIYISLIVYFAHKQ